MTHPSAPEPTEETRPDSDESVFSSSDSQPAPPPADTGARRTATEPIRQDLLARTRAGETWVAIIVFAVILFLLLVFILQNTKKVDITFFWATFTMPLSVAVLLSAVAGVLLTAIAGTLRILQLRRRVRRGQQA
jgi:uncharacterized integral membrane protein